VVVSFKFVVTILLFFPLFSYASPTTMYVVFDGLQLSNHHIAFFLLMHWCIVPRLFLFFCFLVACLHPHCWYYQCPKHPSQPAGGGSSDCVPFPSYPFVSVLGYYANKHTCRGSSLISSVLRSFLYSFSPLTRLRSSSNSMSGKRWSRMVYLFFALASSLCIVRNVLYFDIIFSSKASWLFFRTTR
jgi:hypothetical protein